MRGSLGYGIAVNAGIVSSAGAISHLPGSDPEYHDASDAGSLKPDSPWAGISEIIVRRKRLELTGIRGK